jgi:hypothetical protein
MPQIFFPLGSILDDAGAIVTGATVTIASVKDPATDASIASHGATVALSSDGLRCGVLYDPTTKGDAWITLAISKAGSTFSGSNASPVLFAAADAQTIASRASQASVNALPSPGQVYRLLTMPLRSGRTEAVRYTRGAEGPDLLDHIEDGTGSRIDLTGYTITATMIRMGTEAAVFTSAAATLGNAPVEGQVILDWPTDSLDVPGQYRLIWTATKAASDTLTWQTLVVVE